MCVRGRGDTCVEDRTGMGVNVVAMGRGQCVAWSTSTAITLLLRTWSAVSFTQSMKVATSDANTGSTVKVKAL